MTIHMFTGNTADGRRYTRCGLCNSRMFYDADGDPNGYAYLNAIVAHFSWACPAYARGENWPTSD